MRAGNADGVFVGPHDIAPGLRPLENGDAPGAGSGDLGVVVVRGSRADEAVGPLDILGPVTNGDLNALGVSSSVETDAFMSEPEISIPMRRRTSPSGRIDTPPMPTRWQRLPGTRYCSIC